MLLGALLDVTDAPVSTLTVIAGFDSGAITGEGRDIVCILIGRCALQVTVVLLAGAVWSATLP